MHILLNGNFWSQPNVGSGQYLHGLVRWLPQVAPQHRYTLLLPRTAGPAPPPPPGVSLLSLPTPFDGRSENLAKLWFEQVGVPQVARLIQTNSVGRTILHVPYFAPPLRSRVPVVTTIPDLIPMRLPAYRGSLLVRAYMALVARAVRSSAHIVTFSRYSQREIVEHLRLPAHRVTTILLAPHERYHAQPGNAVAQQVAAQQVAERYNLSPPFVYYVGGLDIRKNVAVLIRAFAQLRQQQATGATLAIAGRPVGRGHCLFPDLDAMIARMGQGDAIRRIEVPDADGPLLYRACTLFVFPSRYEGFGLPPLEAMACGAPVVSSNASSLPEVVGDAALLVAPDDVAGWAAAIGRLLNDSALRDEQRRRGLTRAAHFSWPRVARETVRGYEQLEDGERCP